MFRSNNTKVLQLKDKIEEVGYTLDMEIVPSIYDQISDLQDKMKFENQEFSNKKDRVISYAFLKSCK